MRETDREYNYQFKVRNEKNSAFILEKKTTKEPAILLTLTPE